jgi:putative transposase
MRPSGGTFVIAKKQITTKGSHTMHHSLIRIIRWFCRRLTFNELASAVVIFHEVLSGARKDISFKPDERPPHYRQFRVDQLQPLPAPDTPADLIDWEILKKNIEQKTGKIIKPVQHRNDKKPPPGCKCSHCYAPGKYLYLNNGKLQSQVKCKICGKTSPSHGNKRKRVTKYLCPHCSRALSKWKQSKQSTIYKCFSYVCPHYLNNEILLTKEEQVMRDKQKYDPNFKLHYQYREYHISPDDLITARPFSNLNNDLRRIHNSYHTLGLVLTFAINLGLSSRVARDALKGIFDISLSHPSLIISIYPPSIYLCLLIKTVLNHKLPVLLMKLISLLIINGLIPGSLLIPKPGPFVGIIFLIPGECNLPWLYCTTALANPITLSGILI